MLLTRDDLSRGAPLCAALLGYCVLAGCAARSDTARSAQVASIAAAARIYRQCEIASYEW